jgi:hypothetical protein
MLRKCCPCCNLTKHEWWFKVAYKFTMVAFSFDGWPPGNAEVGTGSPQEGFTASQNDFRGQLMCAEELKLRGAAKLQCDKQLKSFNRLIYPGSHGGNSTVQPGRTEDPSPLDCVSGLEP